MGLLQNILDRLSQRPYLLPPTGLGYQAPEHAKAIGWRCLNLDCQAYLIFDAPQSRIPARCDECQLATEPLLDWPWSHYAHRLELDVQSIRAKHERDEVAARSARFHSLAWTCTDLAIQLRCREAGQVLNRLDQKLHAAGQTDEHFADGPHRLIALRGILMAGQPGLGQQILEQWAHRIGQATDGYHPERPTMIRQANLQSFISGALLWLESACTQHWPSRSDVRQTVANIINRTEIQRLLTSQDRQQLHAHQLTHPPG